MPGAYFVPTRLPGTMITELIYNSDHQNHVDGRAAEFTGAYGISSSQYQLTEDPDISAAGSVSPSLAGDITRIRFVLANIISELSGDAPSNWYDTLAAPSVRLIGARVSRASSVAIPNNFPTVISFSGGTVEFNSTVPAPVFDDMGQPTRFTAPVAGRYFAFCFGTWASNGVGVRQLNMGMNSFTTPGASATNVAPVGNAQAQTITSLFDMQANDYIQFSATQTSGGNLSFTATGGLVFLGS